MTQELKESDIKTIQPNSKFPFQNQTKFCMQSYVDYYRCINIKGEEFEPCKQFRDIFNTICPNDWIQNWDDQRSTNTFPYSLN